MLDFFLAPQMAPFLAALGAVGVIGLFELVAIMVFGPVLSHFHLDGDLPLDGSVLSGVLSWLHMGKVPLLVLLVLFLSGFGLAGLGLQLTLNSLGLGLADAVGVAIPALGIGIASVRRVGRLVANLLGDDITALSPDSFVGETARIVTGTAHLQLAAEACFKDKFGRMHYVMVAPATEDDSFTEGTEVILGARTAIGFEAVRKTKVIN
jgi:hypothetical protein